MQGDNIALREKSCLTVGHDEALLLGACAGDLARPHHDIHAEGSTVTGNHMRNSTPAVQPECLPAQRSAHTDLPASSLEGGHLLGNLASGSENEPPGQFRRGIGWCVGVHA